MEKVWLELNEERGRLIDKKIEGTATEEEKLKLNVLQAYADYHLQVNYPRDDTLLKRLESLLSCPPEASDPTMIEKELTTNGLSLSSEVKRLYTPSRWQLLEATCPCCGVPMDVIRDHFYYPVFGSWDKLVTHCHECCEDRDIGEIKINLTVSLRLKGGERKQVKTP